MGNREEDSSMLGGFRSFRTYQGVLGKKQFTIREASVEPRFTETKNVEVVSTNEIGKGVTPFKTD